jgi:hypothetical protein
MSADFKFPDPSQPLPECPSCKQGSSLRWTTDKQGLYCSWCDFMRFRKKNFAAASVERDDDNQVTMHIDDWSALMTGQYAEGLWCGRWQSAAIVGIACTLLGCMATILSLRWIVFSVLGV